MEYSASRALSRTLAYTNTNTVLKASKVMFKIPAGSVYISTKLVRGATKILRVGGGVAGGVFLFAIALFLAQTPFFLLQMVFFLAQVHCFYLTGYSEM